MSGMSSKRILDRRFGAAVTLAAVITAVIAFGVVGSGAAKSPRGHTAGVIGNIKVKPNLSSSKHGLSVAYIFGEQTVPAGQQGGGSMTCPHSFPHPISGSFDSSSPKLYLTASHAEPVGAKAPHAWFLAVVNTDTQSANALFGIVCAQ
jgi:hypothetical protein